MRLTRAGGERLRPRRAEDEQIRGEAPAPMEKSPGGFRVEGRLFKGLDLDVDVTRARALRQEATVPLSTHSL
jgi:hypothetical protein